MSTNLKGLYTNDVYIIRKLLEQIHNYFKYLECPFYNHDLNERDLLLILVQSSEKRYKILEWMLSRLEPDIDFFLQRECCSGEDVQLDKGHCINAISYLKNLGLCYSRVLVPDIIHAKVSPLIQLKFLVRLLRGIRLKSWNRKPILKKSDINKDEVANVSSTKDKDSMEIEKGNCKSESKISTKDLLHFVDKIIEKNHRVKIILETLEHRLDSEEILNFKEKLYVSLVQKLTEKQNIKNHEEKFSETLLDLPFFEGIIQIIVDEFTCQNNTDENSSYCTSNCCDSNCSLTLNNDTTDSMCTSRFAGDVINLYNNMIKEESVNSNCDSSFREPFKSYSTTINLKKQMSGNGDDCLQSKSTIINS